MNTVNRHPVTGKFIAASNPLAVGKQITDAKMREKLAEQKKRLDTRLHNSPQEQRRIQARLLWLRRQDARKNGYRGPLTREEIARSAR